MKRIELLSVPDCPNAPVLAERVRKALAGRRSVVIHRVIDDLRRAEAAGMAGSPTLLVDGADPFARPGQSPSVSCRLYRDERGRPARLPSLDQVRAALAGRGR